MKISKEETLLRIDHIINAMIDLAIELEFGGWEEFNKIMKDKYPGIKLPDKKYVN